MTDRIETLRAELAEETGEAKTVEIEVLRELLEAYDTALSFADRRPVFWAFEEIWLKEWNEKIGPDVTLSEENQTRLHSLRVQLDGFLRGNPSPWRDIETAPRDGTEILMVEGEKYHVGHWIADMAAEFGDGVEGPNSRWFPLAAPTHWQPIAPLPTPPQPKEDG